MAESYTTAIKTARQEIVKTAIDAGGAAGYIELGTTGMAAVLVTVPLDYPSSSVTGAVLSLLGFPKTVAATGAGVLAEARIRTSAGADVRTGITVGTSNASILVDNTNVVNGQSVTVIATPTITHQ
ncbi:MAG: hypothetical protein PHG25_04375 [Candidatus Pacebacteria bacterium]|nr:hypothetical protein [Candidatus Paceibacterota bacterium]